MTEHCTICGCQLHRTPYTYAQSTVQGRSHATKHHYVAERFFGRSANRRGIKTEDRKRIAGRIELPHEVIACGLASLKKSNS